MWERYLMINDGESRKGEGEILEETQKFSWKWENLIINDGKSRKGRENVEEMWKLMIAKNRR